MYDVDFVPPPSEKQIRFARLIAARTGRAIPWETQHDRQALSDWISDHRREFDERRAAQTGAGSGGATSRQVAFAERISRARRRAVPDECFRDTALMSRWIDSNR